MRSIVYIFVLFFCIAACRSNSQQTTNNTLIGGPCEGCEAVYEYGDRVLSDTDTLPGFDENEPRMRLSGTVYQKDGRSPAADVIIYLYHTDTNGIYAKEEGVTGWAYRHGKYRGWVKTNKDGKFTIYTFRPASYPNSDLPAHIHLTVLEPGKNPYYIDDFFFSDDPNLSKANPNGKNKRGGSGVVTLLQKGYMLSADRKIVLGLNIPDYK